MANLRGGPNNMSCLRKQASINRKVTIKNSSTLRGEDKGEGEVGNKFKSLEDKKLESI